MLDSYYRGEHDIRKRKTKIDGAPNNKIMHPFPKYITDMKVGYMYGTPIEYSTKDENMEIGPLKEALDKADAPTHDAESGKDLSVFGRTVELVYIDNETVMPKLALIDPRFSRVVYSDTVEKKRLLGFYYFPRYDIDGKSIIEYRIIVYTENKQYEYKAQTLDDEYKIVREEKHFLESVPLVEFINNEEAQGDYEQIIDLVNSYNVLQSDRVNDKEGFVNALLYISGATLGYGEGESDKGKRSIFEKIKEGVLEFPEGASIDYITKVLDESQTEILSKSLIYDIHKFSCTPDFTDEQFSGNSSGVAISYKLIALEYDAKQKERYYKRGLVERLKLFIKVLKLKNLISENVQPEDIEIKFRRQLPVNNLEVAQVVSLLKGSVSDESLLTLLSFVVDDPEKELEKIKKEQEEKSKTELEEFERKMNTGNYGAMV